MSGQSGVNPAYSYFYPGTQMLIFAHNNSFGGSVYRISTQQDFTCADKSNGTVQCFGSNTYGQLATTRAVGTSRRGSRRQWAVASSSVASRRVWNTPARSI